jgi:hypothetical protein
MLRGESIMAGTADDLTPVARRMQMRRKQNRIRMWMTPARNKDGA